MWIDVKDQPYGAKGNGSDDDTAAIQAALDDAAFGNAAERNAVYFPPGTYRITGKFELTKCQGVRLIGAGNVQATPVYIGGPGQDRADADTGRNIFDLIGEDIEVVEPD
jgi:pectin methylesterase-like acyl-CoA thioesterase